MDYSLQDYAKKMKVSERTVHRYIKDPKIMIKKQISATQDKSGIWTIHVHNEPAVKKSKKPTDLKKRILAGKVPIEEIKKILEAECFEILMELVDPLEKLKAVDRIIMLERLDKVSVTPANEDVLKALTDAINEIDFTGLTGE